MSDIERTIRLWPDQPSDLPVRSISEVMTAAADAIADLTADATELLRELDVRKSVNRRCFDSITARDIPAGSELVAGYVDGTYRWLDSDWALFPGRTLVRIAVLPSTNDGHVLDVEPGDATPTQAVDWVLMRRAAGADPTVYTGINDWPAVVRAFASAGVAQPHYWVAHYDGDATIPPGAIAKQFANPTLSGGHFDVSSVADFWPGVDMTTPTRMGQSADLQLRPGELGNLEAIYAYPDTHPEGRTILVKVRGERIGRRIITVYPPTDPDADATMLIDAEPTLFVVDILPGDPVSPPTPPPPAPAPAPKNPPIPGVPQDVVDRLYAEGYMKQITPLTVEQMYAQGNVFDFTKPGWVAKP